MSTRKPLRFDFTCTGTKWFRTGSTSRQAFVMRMMNHWPSY